MRSKGTQIIYFQINFCENISKFLIVPRRDISKTKNIVKNCNGYQTIMSDWTKSESKIILWRAICGKTSNVFWPKLVLCLCYLVVCLFILLQISLSLEIVSVYMCITEVSIHLLTPLYFLTIHPYTKTCTKLALPDGVSEWYRKPAVSGRYTTQ